MLRRATTVLATAALALVSLAAPAAAGPPNDGTYRGGCFLGAVNETTQVNNPPDQWDGYVGAYVAVWAPTLGHNPASGQVTCDILVNGVSSGGGSGTGTGVVAFLQPVTFTATPMDSITLCTYVKVTDAHGGVASYSSCAPMVHLQGDFVDPSLIYPLCAALNEYTLCDLLAANRGRFVFIT